LIVEVLSAADDGGASSCNALSTVVVINLGGLLLKEALEISFK
jgi:hypothetical protein